MGNISTWSTTAGGNNTGSPPDFPVEGQAASTVNDTAREGMAAVARWYNDANASLTSGGASNAYTLTTNSNNAALADQSLLAFRANHTNTGNATLNVDSLGAKSLRVGGSATLVANQILVDVVYVVAYNTTNDAYDIVGAFNNDAANLTQGELPDARLSSNVPLRNAANTFTADQMISSSLPNFLIDETDSGALYRIAVNASIWRLTRDDGGIITAIQINGDGAGTITQITLAADLIDFNGSIDADGIDCDLTFTTIDLNGTVEVDGATMQGAFTPTVADAGEVGKLGTPINTQNLDYTLVLTDAGDTIYKASGGAGETITIPAEASVDFPSGTQIDIVNTGGGDLSIAITTDTLRWAGTSETGTRTLASPGWAVIKKYASANWIISGSGLS